MNRFLRPLEHHLTLVLWLFVTLLAAAAAAGLLAMMTNSEAMWSASWWLASGGAILGAVSSIGLGVKKSARWDGAVVAAAFLVFAAWTILPPHPRFSGWFVIAVLVIAFLVSGRRLL